MDATGKVRDRRVLRSRSSCRSMLHRLKSSESSVPAGIVVAKAVMSFEGSLRSGGCGCDVGPRSGGVVFDSF